MEETGSQKLRAAEAGIFSLAVFLPVFILSAHIGERELSRAYPLAWSLFAAAAASVSLPELAGRLGEWRRITGKILRRL